MDVQMHTEGLRLEVGKCLCSAKCATQNPIRTMRVFITSIELLFVTSDRVLVRVMYS